MNRARMHKALDRIIDSCGGGVAYDAGIMTEQIEKLLGYKDGDTVKRRGFGNLSWRVLCINDNGSVTIRPFADPHNWGGPLTIITRSQALANELTKTADYPPR